MPDDAVDRYRVRCPELLRGNRGRDTLIGGPGHDVCYAGATDNVRSCEVVRRE